MEFIVAFDSSPESKSALHSALDMAARVDADVTALYSVQQHVDHDDLDCGYPVIEGLADAEARGELVLTDAQAIAAERGVAIQTETVYGDPVRALTEYVAPRDDACIYVGHRAIASTKTCVGSVAQALIRESPVPVTVVSGV